MQSVNPPRGAFLDFPLGHTAGRPHQPALQREILLEALAAFRELQAPGRIKRLRFRWDEDETWKTSANRNDDRVERLDTPQFQHEDDRLRADAAVPAGCAVCGLHPD